MEFGIVSLFPTMFKALDEGIVGRAKQRGIICVDCWNPREYSTENHQRVDDRPYGGGPGMVMMAEPLRNAINAAKKAAEQAHRVIYLSPQGKLFNQTMAKEVIAEEQRLIFVCGRYEGVDERLIDTEIDEEWSIGDYVMTGGELAAMVIIDSLTRLLPEALGDEQSAQQDSFSDGLLDHPHYTRPAVFEGKAVPEVLLSGDHEAIRTWRRKKALEKTREKRPDLLETKRSNSD